MLSDADIRWPLHQWLQDRHGNDPDTSILHELKIPRPSARIDLAVVNGQVVGFEIKSDIDSLARLTRQTSSFGEVFDRVCMVTTQRHLKGVLAKIPDWWGVLVPSGQSDKLTFKRVRPMGKNPCTNNSALLYTLTRSELLDILRAVGLDKGMKTKKKDALVSGILNDLSSRRLRAQARRVLRKRETKTD